MKTETDKKEISFLEEIRQSIRESREETKERDAKWEQERKEAAAEYEKWKKEMQKHIGGIAESAAEYEKWKKEMQRYVGGISESNGDMAEEMIYNSLEKNKTFAGIKFDKIERNVNMKINLLDLAGEYDVVLKNGDTLAIIETKYKVKQKDVSKFLDVQVPKFRKLFPAFNDYKIILGIGGMSFEDKAINEAKENGVGIIKIVGDKVEYQTEKIKIY